MKKSVIITSIILNILLAAALVFMLQPVKKHSNYLDYYVGKTTIVKSDNSQQPAVVKKKLFNSDRLKTHIKSRAWVQFGRSHLVEIKPESLVSLSDISDALDAHRAKTHLDLFAGKIIAQVKALTGEGDFIVKAGPYVLAVRGTVFSIEKDQKGDITVVVQEGSVSVKGPGSEKDGTMVNTGKKLLIADKKFSITHAAGADLNAFKDIQKLHPIPGIPCATPESIADYFQNYIKGLPAPKIVPEKKADDKKPAAKKTDEKKAPVAMKPAQVVPLGVLFFRAMGTDQAIANNLRTTMYRSLRNKKGNQVVLKGGGTKQGMKNQLQGRLTALGDTLVYAFSVVNVERGNVLFSDTITFQKGQDVTAKIAAAADKIATNAAIWQ